MKAYIDKSALVAEIESLRRTSFTNFDEGVNAAVQTLLEALDTLEVREVEEEPVSNDFEEEFDNYTKDILACDVQFEPFTHLHNCAKYFFELGLKAKGE